MVKELEFRFNDGDDVLISKQTVEKYLGDSIANYADLADFILCKVVSQGYLTKNESNSFSILTKLSFTFYNKEYTLTILQSEVFTQGLLDCVESFCELGGSSRYVSEDDFDKYLAKHIAYLSSLIKPKFKKTITIDTSVYIRKDTLSDFDVPDGYIFYQSYNSTDKVALKIFDTFGVVTPQGYTVCHSGTISLVRDRLVTGRMVARLNPLSDTDKKVYTVKEMRFAERYAKLHLDIQDML